MGILRAMAIRRRVKEMQEYARVLSVVTAELRYRRDILAQVFVRVAKKCRPPYAPWLSKLSQALLEIQQKQAFDHTEASADFDQIWMEHADKLYESSGLKQEDMEYIYITWDRPSDIWMYRHRKRDWHCCRQIWDDISGSWKQRQRIVCGCHSWSEVSQVCY